MILDRSGTETETPGRNGQISEDQAKEAQAIAHASSLIAELLLSNYQNKKHSSHLMHSSLLEQPSPLLPDQVR